MVAKGALVQQVILVSSFTMERLFPSLFLPFLWSPLSFLPALFTFPSFPPFFLRSFPSLPLSSLLPFFVFPVITCQTFRLLCGYLPVN